MLTISNARTAFATTLVVGPLSITIKTPSYGRAYRAACIKQNARLVSIAFCYAGPNYCDFTNRGRDWQVIECRANVACKEAML